MTWTKAQENCLRRNAFLAEPKTAAENSKIKELAVKHNKNDHDIHVGPWIGAKDEAIEGLWVWADSGQTVSWTDWGNTEPNGGTMENCMILNRDPEGYKTKEYKWNDVKCSGRFYSICQMK